MINHSLVAVELKQDSSKFKQEEKLANVGHQKIMDQGAQQDFHFKAGFLPRASPQFCSDTDKRKVLLQYDVLVACPSPLQTAPFRMGSRG